MNRPLRRRVVMNAWLNRTPRIGGVKNAMTSRNICWLPPSRFARLPARPGIFAAISSSQVSLLVILWPMGIRRTALWAAAMSVFAGTAYADYHKGLDLALFNQNVDPRSLAFTLDNARA